MAGLQTVKRGSCVDLIGYAADNIDHDRRRNRWREVVADQIVLYRKGVEPVRGHQTRAATDFLFLRVEDVDVHADVPTLAGMAPSSALKGPPDEAVVRDIHDGIPDVQVGRIANLVEAVFSLTQKQRWT